MEMDETLRNYRDCPLDKFNEAMDMHRRNVPVNELPDDVLYVLFTKWDEDAKSLWHNNHSSYVAGIAMATEKRRDELKAECERRDLVPVSVNRQAHHYETYANLPETDFKGYRNLGWPATLNPHEPPYHIDHEYIIMGRHWEQYHIYLLSLDGRPSHIIAKFVHEKEVRYKPLHGPNDDITFTLNGNKYELHVELR
ncbi:MAG: hypothetical protein HDQ88_06455 [Clostridia bacterium]|nr:hypothetical protein [Clostridia bacterium]